MARNRKFFPTLTLCLCLLTLLPASAQTISAWSHKGTKETLTLSKGRMYLILGHSMCHECVNYFRIYKKKQLAVICLSERDEALDIKYTAAYSYFKKKFTVYTKTYGQICSTIPTRSRPADHFPQLLCLADNGSAILLDYKKLYRITEAFTRPVSLPEAAL